MTNWDDIRYFLTLARAGSVSAAARQLDVNHSTVSRRIQALETRHGVRLFDRTQTGYEMTEAASHIYDVALVLEAQNQMLERQLFANDSRLEGRVCLTLPNDLLNHLLMDHVSRFKQKEPNITLDLLAAKGVRNLANREADIAIRFTPTPPDYLVGREVCKMQMGVYGHLDTQAKDKTKLIVWSDEKEVPQWASALNHAEITLRVDDLFSMYLAVKSGIGIARMPCWLPDSLNDKTVQRLPFELESPTWGIWLLSHIDLKNTARVRVCKDYFWQALNEHKALFEGLHSA
jgi:DNA-binding transcriptional LysR family regulator